MGGIRCGTIALLVRIMRNAPTTLFLLIAVAHSVCAQSLERFEEAIVRPSGPDSPTQMSVKPSQFIARHRTLQTLIQLSYPNFPAWRVSGAPPWATKDLWDVVAKLPPGAPTDQERLYRAIEGMLRTFLAEEFKLKTHFVQKEQPVYELVIAKGGPKLKPSEGATAGQRPSPGGMEIHHQTMEEFASALYCVTCPRQRADRPVIDKTGIDGYFDFTLNWSPSNIQSGDDTPLGPSILTALEEQLGLKLQPAKAAIDFLIIDQAERPQQN